MPVRPRRRPAGNDRGVVLLFVLGIIALLSLLAVSFVFQSRLELRSAQHFESATSADEVAGAGAQAAIRLLELDKQRRLQGPDGAPDTGNEEPYDALVDLWRAGFMAPMRVTYTGDVNEPAPADVPAMMGTLIRSVSAGDAIDPPTGTVMDTGLLVGWDPAGAGGVLHVLTLRPNAWDPSIRTPGSEPKILGAGTVNTQFGAGATVTVTGIQTPPQAVDLNDDATTQQSNNVDDDGDGAVDEATEGLDAIWQNYYDADGRLGGRYAVLVEDENAKANVNVIHNFAVDPGNVDLDPRSTGLTTPGDNVFGRSEGVSTFEISAEDALQATVGEATQLVFHRHGLPNGDNDPVALPSVFQYVAGGAEANRIYVPGQGLSESAGYTDRANDDDDADRLFLVLDGIDNDGDGLIDEADEGVNEPQEFSVLLPGRRQPQAGADFEVDGGDNDGDGVIDEANEGDDQPVLSLEDLVSAELVNLPANWLTSDVQYPDNANAMTRRRNLVTIESQDRNLDRLENPRTNPNYATAEEAAAAARSPFARGFDTFRAAEFQTLQAAINLYDYRDRNLIRDEIADGAGNVFAGVEAVRINEIMVAPSTRLYEGEEGDPAPGPGPGTWDVASQIPLPTPSGAGSPRDADNDDDGAINEDPVNGIDDDLDTIIDEDPVDGDNDGDGLFDEDPIDGIDNDGDGLIDEDAPTDYLSSDASTFARQFSARVTVRLPTGNTAGGPTFLPTVPTDNDGDGVPDEDFPINDDGDTEPVNTTAIFDEDPVADAIDEDTQGGDGEDPINTDIAPPLPGTAEVPADGLTNEDGSNAGLGDVTAKFVIRLRTNENALDDAPAPGPDGVAGIPLNTTNVDRGLLIFVNGEAIWPGGTGPGTTRWGVPATLGNANSVSDGQWFVQQGVCRVVPGANTVQFLKPAVTGGVADRIDIDWFYITFEPDAEWIELVNLTNAIVPVAGWRIQVDAVVDSNLRSTATPAQSSVSLTLPAGAQLPAASAAGPSHTVFAVDAFGVGATPSGGGPTTSTNMLLDQEANDLSSPDTLAYDKLWPTATSAAPTSTNPEAVQLTSVLNLFAPPPRPTGFAADGIDNDGDGNPALACAADPLCDEADEEADDFVPFTELFPNEPINDPANDVSNIDAKNTPTVTEDDVRTGIDVATVSLLDANGNPVDRVTYSASDVGWATDVAAPLATNAGFSVLQRRSPYYAGDRLIPNVAVTGGPLNGTTVDNYVLDSYNGTSATLVVEPVLADGNYDDWPAREDDPYPTPGAVNRTLMAGPDARVKNRHLATVGELGSAPFDVGPPYALAVTGQISSATALVAAAPAVASLALTAADANTLNDLLLHTTAVYLRDTVGGAPSSELLRVVSVDLTGPSAIVYRNVLGPRQAHAGGATYHVVAPLGGSLVLDDPGRFLDATGTPITVTGDGVTPVNPGDVTISLGVGEGANVANVPFPFFLRDQATGTSEIMLVMDRVGDTLRVVRAVLGPDEAHAPGATYDVLAGNAPRLEVATVSYTSTLGNDPSVGDTITNTTQGNTRIVLGVDTTNDRMLVWDQDDDSPWEPGDVIDNGGAFGTGGDTATVGGIHPLEAADVGSLVDAFTVEALPLEPELATATVGAPWSDVSAAGDPAEYRIPIANTAATLRLVWGEADGIVTGTYNMYVIGQAGTLLTIDVLDEANAPIASLNRTALDASEDDHIVAYGTLTLPPGAPADSDGVDNDGDGQTDELELRLRFTNAGAAPTSPATDNRVARVILAPPDRTLGRVNINTASARVLAGLPGLNRDTLGETRLHSDPILGALPIGANTLQLLAGEGVRVSPGSRIRDTARGLDEVLTVASIAGDVLTFTTNAIQNHAAGNEYAPVLTVAERIVEDRRINGPFTSLGDLMSATRGLNASGLNRTNPDVARTLVDDALNNDEHQVTGTTQLNSGGTSLTLQAGEAARIRVGDVLRDVTDLAIIRTDGLDNDGANGIDDANETVTEFLTVSAVNVATDTLTFNPAATQTHAANNVYAVLPLRTAGGGVDSVPVEDELTEAEDVFRAISNLITVRSDLFKIIALGQAAVDANNDGIVQADEVRAEKKLEFVYER